MSDGLEAGLSVQCGHPTGCVHSDLEGGCSGVSRCSIGLTKLPAEGHQRNQVCQSVREQASTGVSMHTFLTAFVQWPLLLQRLKGPLEGQGEQRYKCL